MREDQISNAVAFLVHPKVRDSGEESKRSFLIQKGLTPPEIDEAFLRAGKQEGGSGEGVGEVGEAVVGKPQRYSWGKAVATIALVAAGVYTAHKYAGTWVREWGRKHVGQESDEEDGKSEDVPDHSPQQQLNSHWQSVERLLQDLTHELQVLSSKIDKLLLQNHADFNTSDVTDIKNLLLAASQQGDTVHFTRNHQQMPWVSSQTGVSILEDTATASSQLEKTLPDHPASMKSEEHQREYMRALGLAMDDGTIGDTQVAGTIEGNTNSTSDRSTAEIAPDTAHQTVGTVDSTGPGASKSYWASRNAADAWQPPPLPAPVIPLTSQDANEA